MIAESSQDPSPKHKSSPESVEPSIDHPDLVVSEGPAEDQAIVLCLDFSENFGELTDYLSEYEDGKMTAEAKAIYEAILERSARYRPPAARGAHER